MKTFYTYLLGWSLQNKFYYGVRYSKKAKPEDLWTTYFTSSRHVKAFAAKYGKPDIIQIRQTFNSKEKAITWESKVLKRMRVIKNDKWLNQTDNRAIVYSRTDETKQKFSRKMKGRNSPFKGKTHSAESIELMRSKHKGKKTGRTKETFTDDWKEKISRSKKGQIRTQSEKEILLRKEKAKDSNFSKLAQGTIWINNGIVSKRINPGYLDRYPGFTVGRLITNQGRTLET